MSKIFTAKFIGANYREISQDFDDFTAAKEWACIRQEASGEDNSQIKIMRGLFAVVWAFPELRSRRIEEARARERWLSLPDFVVS